MQWHEFQSRQSLDKELSMKIGGLLSQGIEQRQSAYLVVSGGETPLGLFRQLAQLDLPWEKVTVLQADERCVSCDHQDSNARLINENLLQHKAKKAAFINLHDSRYTINELEQTLGNIPLFDVVILGMGHDGHTASLFPCAENLQDAMDDGAANIIKIKPKTAPYERITLSKARLFKSKAHFLHLVGAQKKATCLKAIDSADAELMPIYAFFSELRHDLQIYYTHDTAK